MHRKRKGEMNQPEIITSGRDEGNNLTFDVVAYRKLTNEEAANVIAMYLRSLGKKKIQNQTIRLTTVIGLNPGS